MTDLAPANILGGPAGESPLSARYFKNMESFPGQLLVTPPALSAKEEGKIARRDAVRLARHAERTSVHIRAGLDRKADLVTGATLRVHPQPDFEALGIDDKEKRRKLRRLMAREFNAWAYDTRCLCDAEGHYDFGGLMRMSYRNLEGPDAETCGVIHYDEDRAAHYNSRWATFVTIVDPDRVRTPPMKVLDDDIHEGRHLDEHGRMVGLYILKRHPTDGANGFDLNDFAYVPRENEDGRPMAWHWFRKDRGGAQRGLTRLVTILRQNTMLDRYSDAKLGSAVKAAIMAPYIETVQTAEEVKEMLAPAAGGSSPWDMQASWLEKARFRIGPQALPILPPGTKPQMLNTDPAGVNDAAFIADRLRQMALSLGLTFEQFTGNLEGVNYSSIRAGILDAIRGVMSERALFTKHGGPSLCYAAVMEEAFYRGRFDELGSGLPDFREFRFAYVGCGWTGPGIGEVDPLKAAQADEIKLRNRVTTRSRIAAVNGEDWEENFDQLAEEEAYADELELSLDPTSPVAATDPEREDPKDTGDE